MLSTLCLYFVSTAANAAQPGTQLNPNNKLAAACAHYGASQAVRGGDFLFIGGIVAMSDDGSTIAPHGGAGDVGKP